MAKTKRIFLIDGMAIAYRSYYAFIQNPLINSRGENTSAIFGFVNFLNKILEEEKPDYIAVAFDTGAPTFRHKEFPEYKATREKMPEDMASQLEYLKEIVRAYNIPVIEKEGFEADDVIGTLAKQSEAKGIDSFLVTPDKDFMQLVSKRTKLYKPGRQGNDFEIIDIKGVQDFFGVPPEQVIDVLGLIGDKSDNVPGVPGIGPKTATPLIQEYGSIETLLENIDSLSKKGLREKLKTHQEEAVRSKKLVTIDTNVPLDIKVEDLISSEKKVSQLQTLFERLELRSFLKKLKEEKPTDSNVIEAPEPLTSDEPEIFDINSYPHSFKLIQSIKELSELCATLRKSKRISFDTETTSTDPLKAELVGLSFSQKSGEAFFIPVTSTKPNTGSTEGLFSSSESAKDHKGEAFRPLPLESVLTEIKPLLEDPEIGKIGQNLKYDILVMKQYGIDLEGIEFDTMLASYLLRSDSRHNLDAMAMDFLSYKTIAFDDLVGTGRERKDIRDVSLQELSDYACEDAETTFRLYEILKDQLKESDFEKLFYEIELPLLQVLARMESTGFMIDTKNLNAMSKELDRMLSRLTDDIYRHAGGEFNINSTQQLSEILFSTLKLTPVRKTKTGFSTDMGVLEQLHDEHPIISSLLEYRQLSKLKSTYVDALPQLINQKTGRVHTSFNQTVTTTGRLSSSDPNLQNIPIRTEIGRSIRSAFVPSSPDRIILSSDYSQIELRIMAHISGDEGLGEAFHSNEDIHTTTASKVFVVKLKDVTREMRRKAKEVNFGIMYGIGPFGLARRLDISQSEAKEIIDRYFERFPKVKAYIDSTIETAKQNGYVETLLGRRRYFPDIHSRNHPIRQNAERQAINMPIQGTAADMIKIAMVKIDRELLKRKMKSVMILQVHDELVFDVLTDEETSVRNLVRDTMEKALILKVPIQVDIGTGKTWLEAH